MDFGLDALCDLIESDEATDIAENSKNLKCDTNPEQSDVKDMEKRMKEMQEEMKRLQNELQKTKNENISSSPSTNKNAKILHDSEVDLFSSSSVPESNNMCMSDDTKRISQINGFDNDDNPFVETTNLSEDGQNIQRILDGNSKSSDGYKQPVKWKSKQRDITSHHGHASKTNGASEVEPFSGIRIVNPLISSSTMQERMVGRKMIKMSVMHFHINGGEISGDWVTVGVIVNKLDPKKSKNGNSYSIWKLCDLNDCDKIMSMFLFGNVHKQHWKTPLGSVIGILNATIMENKETKSSDLAVTVDHPQKLMLIGTSRDFGFCKSTRKDGQKCTIFVNKHKCEYCQYHVKSAYQKMSSKRFELQASYSGVEPRGLRNKILKSQEVMYGGQMFTSNKTVGSHKKCKQKDKLILGNLGIQNKVEKVVAEEKSKAIINRNLSEKENSAIQQISRTSENLSKMMNVSSPGSRNLLRHLVKEGEKATDDIKSISAKDLLKMHQAEMLKKRLESQNRLDDSPRIGRGCKPGRDIIFEDHWPSVKPIKHSDVAKQRAIQKIKKIGSIKQKDPNAVKSKNNGANVRDDIRQRVDSNCVASSSSSDVDSPPSKRNCIDDSFNVTKSELKMIMERKSSHQSEVNEEENERMGVYFEVLEKKEQLETKMTSIKEIVVDAVSCKECHYTSFHQSEMCRQRNHAVVRHKAKKRFFKCENCKQRMICLTKIPNKPCRNCGLIKFVRIGMWEERQTSKQELFIRQAKDDHFSDD